MPYARLSGRPDVPARPAHQNPDDQKRPGLLLAVDTSTTRAGIALYGGSEAGYVLAESIWEAGRDIP